MDELPADTQTVFIILCVVAVVLFILIITICCMCSYRTKQKIAIDSEQITEANEMAEVPSKSEEVVDTKAFNSAVKGDAYGEKNDQKGDYGKKYDAEGNFEEMG